ncbi:MAG: zinc ribbon domain-containing protein [Candidatus Lokiarchaeota archaeon]|nr:zinc ribbon domain-containing protein [Candidatus Lokiarchaeota archaeon]
MIFDEMHEYMGHMMDWVTPNGALIFLGVISFIAIVVILLLVLNRHTNPEESIESTIDVITPSVRQEEFKPSEITNYCPECGSKLDDRSSKFCSLCGIRL